MYDKDREKLFIMSIDPRCFGLNGFSVSGCWAVDDKSTRCRHR